jgi:hypothetical protein
MGPWPYTAAPLQKLRGGGQGRGGGRSRGGACEHVSRAVRGVRLRGAGGRSCRPDNEEHAWALARRGRRGGAGRGAGWRSRGRAAGGRLEALAQAAEGAGGWGGVGWGGVGWGGVGWGGVGWGSSHPTKASMARRPFFSSLSCLSALPWPMGSKGKLPRKPVAPAGRAGGGVPRGLGSVAGGIARRRGGRAGRAAGGAAGGQLRQRAGGARGAHRSSCSPRSAWPPGRP